MERRISIGLGVAALIAVAAVAVRAIPAPRAPKPEDVVEEGPRIVEPMQMLGRGAALRAPELDTWIEKDRATRFKALRGIVFNIWGCPGVVEWLDTADGQRTERLLAELRGGKREEALAALVFVFELARRLEWDPRIFSTTRQANAERLAGLYADWLHAWSDRGARDPLLAEPTRAATLVYGRLMRTAQQSPLIGSDDAPYQRALRLMSEITGVDEGRRTALGEALHERYPAAMRRLFGEDDRLRGLDEEALTLFPDLKGACDG